MKIQVIENIKQALPLVWDVFCKYESVNYSDSSGKQAFWNVIHSEEYLKTLRALGAYEGNELIGVIATRYEGRHVAFFFVDGNHHRKGVGRALWNTVLAENTFNEITVNSSIYATEIYKKLGFRQMGGICERDGIRYVPMKYEMLIREDCPCKKTGCFRHGHCNECRAHHTDAKRPRPCETEGTLIKSE